MDLQVLQDYRCREIAYTKGKIITVTAAEAASLLADSPESFEIVAVEKAVEQPPVNRAARVSVKK